MRKFHDNNHAHNRLSRCFCIYKTNDGIECGRISLATKEKIIIDERHEFRMNDEKSTSFLFPRLGYYNTRHQCTYVTRSSKRMWKVGLVPENMLQKPLFPMFHTMADGKEYSEILKFLHIGKYPTFDRCLKDIKGGFAAGRAFSRDFCLGLHAETKEVVLYYRNMPIGHYDSDEKAVIIGDVNSHYIQKFLEVTGGKVGVLV